MTPEDELRRAQRADGILNDDLFKEAIKALRDDAMDKFKSASPGDLPSLADARMRYDVTESFVNTFMKFMRDGQFAKVKIDDAEKKKRPPVEPYMPRHST